MKVSITLKAQPELIALASELTSFISELRAAMATDPAVVMESARAGMMAGMAAAAHPAVESAPRAAEKAAPDAAIAEEDRPDVGAEMAPAAATESAPEPEPTEKEKAPDAAPKDGSASESQKTLAEDPAAASALIQELSKMFLVAKSNGFAEEGSKWLPNFLDSLGFKSHLEIPVGHVSFVLMNARQALNISQEAA